MRKEEEFMLRKTIRCTECNYNPTRLFDLLISEDGHVYIETKCKKDGVVLSNITDDIKLMLEQLNSTLCA